MPSYYTLTSGTTAQAQDVNQLINALNGSAGNGIPTSLTAVNDSVNFALAVKNADPTNSRSLQVLRSNNNVLLQADANGVIVSPDGGVTTGQVLTVNATQTLTNKTLTSPHMTGPVVDSGGLTVTAGGFTVSAGGATISGATTVNVTGGAVAASGAIRLNGAQLIGFRNGGNTGDDTFGFDASDRFSVSGLAGAIGNGALTNIQAPLKGTGGGPTSINVASWVPVVWNGQAGFLLFAQ